MIQGYGCNFRRWVVRVCTQKACRANSQSGKHYPWKPNCPWRDAANRWISSSPINYPSGTTERCFGCTSCRKHGRWRSEYLEGLDIYLEGLDISLLKASYFLVVPTEDCRGNIVGLNELQWAQWASVSPSELNEPQWAGWGSRKEHETGGKGTGHNFWKNVIAWGHNINRFQDDKSNLTKPWSSVYTLNDTPWVT